MKSGPELTSAPAARAAAARSAVACIGGGAVAGGRGRAARATEGGAAGRERRPEIGTGPGFGP